VTFDRVPSSWETGSVIRLAVRGFIVAAAILSIGTNATAASRSVTANHIALVAVGDSLPYGRADCGFCQTFVDLFRAAVAQYGHVLVTERNLSEHTGIDSSDLRRQMRSNRSLRRAIAGASVITVTIGHNDPPWNNDHDSCDGSGGYPHADYSKYGAACVDATASLFRSNLKSILQSITTLRAGRATILRVTNDYNDSIGDPVIPRSAYAVVKPFYDRDAAIACELARKYHGMCIDTYHAFNGKNGDRDAGPLLARDHTHPNAKGHKLIAQLLVRAGYRPLFP
jgi:lysophospholipase L1-like esterase